jgi:hypothetical protein
MLDGIGPGNQHGYLLVNAKICAFRGLYGDQGPFIIFSKGGTEGRKGGTKNEPSCCHPCSYCY